LHRPQFLKHGKGAITMPFIDKPRFFVPPEYCGTGRDDLSPPQFRPPGPVQWLSPEDRARFAPAPFAPRFGTSSADDSAARDVQKRLNRVKLAQARDQIADFQAERPFQRMLERYKLQSMQDAMAAAQSANESYGLFPTGAGLGLGFQQPYMDIASDQGRHARGFELLKNALEAAAPPTTIEGKGIGRNTTSVPDFVDMLEQGANFDPMGLSLADRDRVKEAIKIKALRDAQRARGGF
jgi:hypothetical protein